MSGIRVPDAQYNAPTPQPEMAEVPMPKQPVANANMFGAVQAAAGEQAGTKVQGAVTSLADELIQRKMWQQQSDMYDNREAYRDYLDKGMYDQSTHIVKDASGNEREVPNGFLNRTDPKDLATMSQDVQAYIDKGRQQFMPQETMLPVARQYSRLYGAMESNIKAKLAGYVDTTSLKNTELGLQRGVVGDTTHAGDYANVENAMAPITETSTKYSAWMVNHKGWSLQDQVDYGQKMHNLGMEKYLDTHIIANGMTLDQAKEAIQTVADHKIINDDQKAGLIERSQTLIDKMQHQQNVQDIHDMVSNRSNLLNQIASKQLDISHADQLADNIGLKDPALAEALKESAKSGGWFGNGKYVPQEDKDQAFSDIAQSIFKSKSQKEISDFTLRALKQSANGEISQDRLNILMNAAILRNKNMPLGSKYDEANNFNPIQKAIDNAATSLTQWQEKTGNKDGNLWTRFMSYIGNKMHPQDAHDQALQETKQDHNPTSVQYKVGSTITDPKGQAWTVVSFNDKGEPMLKRGSGKSSK